MQLYLGATNYDIFPSYRTEGAWNVSINEERFDLLRMRKILSDRGACVIAGVTKDEAMAWIEANPIDRPQGWARVREVLAHYDFIVRFWLGLAD